MTHPDDAGRRLSEALHAQASRGPMPPADRGRPPRPAPGPPPRVPGRVPPPAPRPQPGPPQMAPPQPVAPSGTRAEPAVSNVRQIVWAMVVTLLVGAILGGGLALLSLLLPGLLPAIG